MIPSGKFARRKAPREAPQAVVAESAHSDKPYLAPQASLARSPYFRRRVATICGHFRRG